MLSEIYDAAGGSAEETVRRLGSEEFVRTVVKKFATDDTFCRLKSALAAEDCEAAFRAAHTLKGVCANLGFDRLAELGVQLTELLRNKNIDGAKKLMCETERCYEKLIAVCERFFAASDGI